MSDPTPEVEPESAGESDMAEQPIEAADVTIDPVEPTADAAQTTDTSRPNYKGAPLDAEAGPGLGCFWIQVGLLIVPLLGQRRTPDPVVGDPVLCRNDDGLPVALGRGRPSRPAPPVA